MSPAPILAAILTLAPYGRVKPPPGWAEPEEAYRARMASIAETIAGVARNRNEAAALVGVALHESGFAADVDAGRCYAGWRGRCDGGRAVSLWQLQDRDPDRLERYRTDRAAAAREALRRILGSLGMCRGNPPELRLAAFASGTCISGHQAARELDVAVRRARSMLPK